VKADGSATHWTTTGNCACFVFCRDSEALKAFAQDAYQCSLAYGPLDVRTSLAYYNLAKVFQGMNEMDKSLLYCDQVCTMLHVSHTEHTESTPSQITALCADDACRHACILRSFSFNGMSLLRQHMALTVTPAMQVRPASAGVVMLAKTIINRVDGVEMLVQVLSIWSPALLDLVASRVDQSSQSPAVQQVLLDQRLHAK